MFHSLLNIDLISKCYFVFFFLLFVHNFNDFVHFSHSNVRTSTQNAHTHTHWHKTIHTECPPAMDGMERFACPTPDRQGRYRCIDDHVLCDGFIDCPDGEDEERQACMFYKTVSDWFCLLSDFFFYFSYFLLFFLVSFKNVFFFKTNLLFDVHAYTLHMQSECGSVLSKTKSYLHFVDELILVDWCAYTQFI